MQELNSLFLYCSLCSNELEHHELNQKTAFSAKQAYIYCADGSTLSDALALNTLVVGMFPNNQYVLDKHVCPDEGLMNEFNEI